MSNVEICQVAYEGRLSRLKALLEANPKLISVADQVLPQTQSDNFLFIFLVNYMISIALTNWRRQG